MTSPPSHLQTLDSNVRAIQAIEGAWTLPALPDEVTVDLAMNANMQPDALKQLLVGMEEDIDLAQATQPRRPTFRAQFPENMLMPSHLPPGEAAGRLFTSVVGADRPEQYAPDAVQRWKQRAVAGGYLDLTPEEIADPRWYPEFGAIAGEMLSDQMRKEFSGDKPGSISIDGVMNVVEDWLSPRGLYRAALELDLMWDPGAIGREFSSWDDKWSAWKEEPWNVRRAIDALTGPIDDIVFPAMNWALMLSGVGAVANTAVRLMPGAAKLIAGLGTAANGLSRAARAIPGGRRALVAADVGEDIARFRTQSLTASLLRKPGVGDAATRTGALASGMDKFRSLSAVEGTHNQLQRWRNLSGVVMTKKMNQQVLRAGFVSNAQSLVDDERGRSIASETTLDDVVNEVMANPAVDWAVDLLIYPPNIFEPGTVRAFLGGAGRVAGRGVGFAQVAENQQMTMAAHRAVRNFIEDTMSADEVAHFDDLVNTRGINGALQETLAFGDGAEGQEQFGAFMAWATGVGAVNAAARQMGPLQMPAEGIMASSELYGYFAGRGHIFDQLRHIDERDIDGLFDSAIRGVIDELIPARSGGAPAAAAARKLELRTSVADEAFDGTVQAGDVRLFGTRDLDSGVITWSLTPGDGDPFFMDVNLAEFGFSSADEVMANLADVEKFVARRYVSPAGHRYRVSEAAEAIRYDQNKLENLRSMVRTHNGRRQEIFANLMAGVDSTFVEQAIYEMLPTVRNWSNWTNAIADVRQMQRAGVFDDVAFAPTLTESGRRMATNVPHAGDPRWRRELYDMALQLGNDQDLLERLNNSVFAPLLREIDPAPFRVTVAGIDQVTKQQADAFGHMVQSHIARMGDYEKFGGLSPSLWDDLDEALAGTQGSLDSVGGRASRKQVADAVAYATSSLTVSPDQALRIRRLVHWAIKEGVSMADLGKALDGQAAAILADSKTWNSFRVADQFGMNGTSVERLLDKAKELKKQSNYIAAELDVPAEVKEHMANLGYKVVYGVHFAAPEDFLDVVPELADATRRHVRSAHMQTFFQRKQPDATNALKARVLRSALMGELANAGEGVRLTPNDATVDRILGDMHELLDKVQMEALDAIEGADGFVGRTGARISKSLVPFDVTRLPSGLSAQKFLDEVSALGYSQEEALLIQRALMKGQDLGWHEQGLYRIESFLRSRNNAVDGLRFLGSNEASNRFTNAARHVAAPVFGGTVGGMAAGEDAGFEERLMFGAAGIIAGNTAVRKGARWADALEASKFAKYGYIADNLANVRDRFRFSLSPIFDASRYSEGIIMAQIGEMPDGLRNPRVNQSPRGVRRAMGRNLKDANPNMSDAEVRRAVQAQWAQNRNEFAAAARNDFEMETIDDVGRRFSSVGILGYSPVAWMESTFWHLRQHGVDPRKAYETVRDIYTYGTTGRSAAELSMNFVFFPFSFTKKVVTHLGKFFQHDMGRLILLQDGLATYQALSEHYDLSNEFRDRLPVLNRMQRMNVLAYGLGPGRFGGVNAPMMGAAMDTPIVGDLLDMATPFDVDNITNLFVPQMVRVHNERDASQLWDITKQMLPALNDVNQLLGDLYSQGRVIASDSHLTTQAEQRRGWDEWRDFQQEVIPMLDAAGISWSQALRDPALGSWIRQRRADISAAYPSWKQAFGDGIGNAQALNLEKEERLMNPVGTEDIALQEFETAVQSLTAVGLSFENPEDIPPEVYPVMRRIATELAQADPRFKRLYDRFYRRIFGDLGTEVF